MNIPFPRIITLLRKERGISQKKAAADLGISQALLSHYEKGIRECGLDFVVRVADYYGVSCDYLLGRTADKSGTTISIDDIPNTSDASTGSVLPYGSIPELSKKLIINSLHIVFDLLQKCENKNVTEQSSLILILSVYSVFRHIYAANPKNLPALFSVSEDMFRPMVSAEIIKSAARLSVLCAGRPCDGLEPLPADKAPLILRDNLAREYPLFASSLLTLLQNAETMLEKTQRTNKTEK